MLCTEFPCKFSSNEWKTMKNHYKTKHPKIKRPDKYFTKKTRNNKT